MLHEWCRTVLWTKRNSISWHWWQVILLKIPKKNMFLIKKGQTFQNFKITYRSSTLMFAYETYFTILLHRLLSHKMMLPSSKTKVKPSQFRTKAAATSFIQQHIDAHCDAWEHSLKFLQGKIQNYIESKKNIHKMQGSLSIVELDQNIQFSSMSWKWWHVNWCIQLSKYYLLNHNWFWQSRCSWSSECNVQLSGGLDKC